jgi:hypothetical protein
VRCAREGNVRWRPVPVDIIREIVRNRFPGRSWGIISIYVDKLIVRDCRYAGIMKEIGRMLCERGWDYLI